MDDLEEVSTPIYVCLCMSVCNMIRSGHRVAWVGCYPRGGKRVSGVVTCTVIDDVISARGGSSNDPGVR